MTETGPLLAAAFRAMDTAAEIAKGHKAGTATSKGDRDMVTDLDIGIERAVRASLKQRRAGRGVPRRGGKPGR